MKIWFMKVIIIRSLSQSADEILFGPLMPQKELFQEYWEYRRHKLSLILDQLAEDHDKYAELTELYQRIDKQLKTSS